MNIRQKKPPQKSFVNPFKSMGKLLFECYISPKRSKKNTKLYYYDFVCKRERRWLWNFLNSCMFTFYSRWTRFYMTYFFFVIHFSLLLLLLLFLSTGLGRDLKIWLIFFMFAAARVFFIFLVICMGNSRGTYFTS